MSEFLVCLFGAGAHACNPLAFAGVALTTAGAALAVHLLLHSYTTRDGEL